MLTHRQDLARKIITTSGSDVLQTNHWTLVPADLKLLYNTELQKEVESRIGATEFAELQRLQTIGILRDNNMADHFMLIAYQTIRNYKGVRQKDEEVRHHPILL